MDWAELLLCFQRNIADTTGLEPYRFFNVVQFMMYDKDSSGTVTLDETMACCTLGTDGTSLKPK